MTRNEFYYASMTAEFPESLASVVGELKALASEKLYIQGQMFPTDDNGQCAQLNPRFMENEFAAEINGICPGGDHDFEDHSHGGPESGCISLECRRCGYSIHHTLY